MVVGNAITSMTQWQHHAMANVTLAAPSLA
jgi:hypothetical protein